MYFFKQEKDYIVKYEITLNKEELESLKLEIINKCSHITHKHYKTTNTPDWLFDYIHIRNYNEKKIGEIVYDDFYYTRIEDEYEVDYNYYEDPILIKYIDLLIQGDTNVIEQIKNFKIKEKNKEEILLKKEQRILKSINNLSTKNISNKISDLKQIQEELLKYKEEKELNKNQVSPELYKDKVLSCINYKEIDKLPIDVVLNVQNFLSCCSEKTIDSKLNKILKMNK